MSRKGQIIPSSDVRDFENALPGGVYNVTPPVATDGQYVPDQMDAGGNKKVTIVASSGGASAMTIAEDTAETAGEQIMKGGRVRRDTAASSAGSSGDWSTPNSDSLGHDWSREGYAPLAEDNTNGVIQMVVKPLAVATYSPTLFTDFGANTTLNIKATPGNVLGFVVTNTNAAIRYFQLHNTATTPAGAAVPLLTFMVPALTGNLFVGMEVLTQAGINFSTGIAYATSTTQGTYTAATAGDHFVMVTYK